MSWLETQISLYECHSDNQGRPATFRDILLSQFAIPHDYKLYQNNSWITGRVNDLETIVKLRTTGIPEFKKKILKSTLQCYTPAGILRSKRKGEVEIISRTGILQLDFDHETIKQYHIEECKQAVFALPFVAFCGLSCSGTGFYTLVKIAEPEKLEKYAEHCFRILEKCGLKADISKGKKSTRFKISFIRQQHANT